MSVETPVFTPAIVPATPAEPTPDEAPESTHELSCTECGKELVYGGRGRKPTKCDDHKRTPPTTTARRSLGKSDQLAAQATEALCQMNGILAIGVMMLGLPLTAEALETSKDVFREQAYSALLTDPGMCAMILRGGTSSGKIALVIAYGMLGATVIPVGMMEVKAKREIAATMADAADSE